MVMPEGEEKGTEILFKSKMAEKFPNLGKEMDSQIHKAQKFPNTH